MALIWTNTNNAHAHGVKILGYGGPGAGKTRLVATLPRPIVASAESGLLSIVGSNITVATISAFADIIEFYKFCVGSAEMRNYDSIAIDSLSEIAEKVLATAKAAVNDPRQGYGEMLDRMIALTKYFRDIQGKHVYVSAKMEYEEDEQKRFHYGPMMPGRKLGNQLPYLFDEVFYAHKRRFNINGIEKDVEVLQTYSDEQHIAPKDRSGRLEALEQPHLGNVINKIIGVR